MGTNPSIAAGPASELCDLCSDTEPHAQGVPCLAECSAVAVLKFLILFQQGAPHFHFALGPTNYVPGPMLQGYVTCPYIYPTR